MIEFVKTVTRKNKCFVQAHYYGGGFSKWELLSTPAEVINWIRNARLVDTQLIAGWIKSETYRQEG